ncbi:MAG: hypothetical protein JO174_13405, partial [Herbaspirillum sp.]|nr:hypothetical protein [Herbaspirillum sp.]
EMVDVAEGEFERDRPDLQRTQGLPPPAQAVAGELETLRMPVELGELISQLTQLAQLPELTSAGAETVTAQPLADVVLGGSFGKAAYRMQLLPLLGDRQARTLQGQTGDLARLPWQAGFLPVIEKIDDPDVLAMSAGAIHPESSQEKNHE